MAAFGKGFNPWRKRGSFRRLTKAELAYQTQAEGGMLTCLNMPDHKAKVSQKMTDYTTYLQCDECLQISNGRRSHAVIAPEACEAWYNGQTVEPKPMPKVTVTPAPEGGLDVALEGIGGLTVSQEQVEGASAKGQGEGQPSQGEAKQGQAQTPKPQVTGDMPMDLAALLAAILAQYVTHPQADEKISKAVTGMAENTALLVQESVKYLEEKIAAIPASTGTTGGGTVTIKVNDVSIDLPEGTIPHSQLKDVLAACALEANGRPALPNFLLKGHAGTGKTTMAEHLALALGFTDPNQFVAVSIVPDMPSSALMGRVLVNLTTGKESYIPSALIPIIVDGGVIFLDEADNADPQILVALNSLTANGFVRLPDGNLIKRHPRCFVGLGMNTNGDGASRQYTRAQLDTAFLDRFVGNTHDVDYCPVVEAHLCPEQEIRDAVLAVRKAVAEKGVRRVVSTRFMMATRALVKGQKISVKKAIAKSAALWTEADRKAVGI